MMKKGFTLAEVLITLTIIGVVAALTIPSLYSKYQKHTYVVGLKKAYSILQNVVKMIPVSEGCPAGDLDCAGFFDATNIDGQDFNGNIAYKQVYLLSKHMKVDKFCDGDYGRKQSTCYRPGTGPNTTETAMYYILYYKPKAGFITQDGMIWAVRWAGEASSEKHNNYIMVDVNGKKGPNKRGLDTFSFTIAVPEMRGIKRGTVMPTGGRLYNQYVYENPASTAYCNPPTEITLNCTGRVLENDAIDW